MSSRCRAKHVYTILMWNLAHPSESIVSPRCRSKHVNHNTDIEFDWSHCKLKTVSAIMLLVRHLSEVGSLAN